VFIDRRTELHADAIRESVTANSALLQERLAGQGALFAERGGDASLGTQQAIGQLAVQIHQQAVVMTYSDCFYVLGVGLIILMPMVLILRRANPAPPPANRALRQAPAGAA
jgi:MFS transporter, DHA2 family, multidrug resistance protein